MSGSPADLPAVRAARVSDARGMADVHVATWRAAYAGQPPDRFLRRLSVEERTRSWRSRIAAKRADEAVLVAVRGLTVVGFASGGPTRDKGDDPRRVGEIYAVYLLPEEWGRGGGRALLGHAISALAAAGFEDASLWVLETEPAGPRLLRARGLAPRRRDEAGALRRAGHGGALQASAGATLDRVIVDYAVYEGGHRVRGQDPPG